MYIQRQQYNIIMAITYGLCLYIVILLLNADHKTVTGRFSKSSIESTRFVDIYGRRGQLAKRFRRGIIAVVVVSLAHHHIRRKNGIGIFCAIGA